MKTISLKICLCAFAAVLCPPVLAQAAVKQPLRGLIAMGDISFHRVDDGVPDNSLQYIYDKPGILDGIVLNVTWDQLEPKPNAINTSVIDKALANVRTYNKKYPKTPLGVRLRVWAGPNAPKWVKKINGPSVTIQYSSVPITIGRFWNTHYGNAWHKLQVELAKKYDNDPLVREVGMTSCSSVTSEPFIFAGGAVSLKKMHTAGFTDGKYINCLMRAPRDYLAWQNTLVEFPFDPFRYSDSGKPHPSTQMTVKIMRAWRKAMGQNGVLSNHALPGPAPITPPAVYAAIKKLGQPIAFQFKYSKGMDWDATVRYGLSLGAGSIEIWPDTFNNLPSQQLKQWSLDIKRNQTP